MVPVEQTINLIHPIYHLLMEVVSRLSDLSSVNLIYLVFLSDLSRLGGDDQRVAGAWSAFLRFEAQLRVEPESAGARAQGRGRDAGEPGRLVNRIHRDPLQAKLAVERAQLLVGLPVVVAPLGVRPVEAALAAPESPARRLAFAVAERREEVLRLRPVRHAQQPAGLHRPGQCREPLAVAGREVEHLGAHDDVVPVPAAAQDLQQIPLDEAGRYTGRARVDAGAP